MADGKPANVCSFNGFLARRAVRRLKSLVDAACIDEVVDVPHTQRELMVLRARLYAENDNYRYVDFVLSEALAGRVRLKAA